MSVKCCSYLLSFGVMPGSFVFCSMNTHNNPHVYYLHCNFVLGVYILQAILGIYPLHDFNLRSDCRIFKNQEFKCITWDGKYY